MPQATDLVIKNGAATPINKTFVLVSPAAGDGGIAKWVLKEGTIASVFPTLTASAYPVGAKSRNLKVRFRLPSSFTDTVTGRTNVDTAAEMNVTFSIPDTYPENLKSDFVAFCINSLAAPLFQAMARDAYGAT